MSVAFELFVLIVGTLLVCAPGVPLVLALRLHEHLPAPLVPAALLTVGVLPTSAILTVTLHEHRPIRYVLIGLAAWVVLGGALAALLGHRRRQRAPVETPARPWEWVAHVPRGVWISATLIAGATFLVGAPIESDTLYHAAQSLKLGHLQHPTLSNTLMFRTGGAHPGYLIPVWQEYVALISRVSGAHPTTVMMVMPTLISFIMALTFGGLFLTLATGARHAGTIGSSVAALSLLRIHGDGVFVPSFYPSPVVIRVMLPLALASWALCVWSDRREVRRSALVLLPAATLAVLISHVSYIAWLLLAAAGMLVASLIRGQERARLLRRAAVSSAVVGAVSAGWIALLTPALNTLNSSADTTRQSLARFADVLAGSVASDSFHLRAEHLLHHDHTIVSLVGMAIIPIVALRRRIDMATMYVAGTSTLVLWIASSDTLFPWLTRHLSVAQSARIGATLPLVIAAALAVELLWAQVADRGIRLGSLAGALLVLAAGAVAACQWLVPSDLRLHVLQLHVEISRWLLPLTLIGALPLRVALGKIPSGSARTDTPRVFPSVAIVCCVLLAAPTVVGAALRIGNSTASRPASGTEAGVLHRFTPEMRRTLLGLHTGDIVLASPYTSFDVMALAPVYVVGSAVWHVPDTPANDRQRRARLARRFFGAQLTDDRRAEIIAAQRVTWVLVDRESTRPDALSFLGSWGRKGAGVAPLAPALRRSWPERFVEVERDGQLSLFRVAHDPSVQDDRPR